MWQIHSEEPESSHLNFKAHAFLNFAVLLPEVAGQNSEKA